MPDIGKGEKPSKEAEKAAPSASNAKKVASTTKGKNALKGMMKTRKSFKEKKSAQASKKVMMNIWTNVYEPAMNELINTGHVYEHASTKHGYILAFYKAETMNVIMNQWFSVAENARTILLENNIKFKVQDVSKIGKYLLSIEMQIES